MGAVQPFIMSGLKRIRGAQIECTSRRTYFLHVSVEDVFPSCRQLPRPCDEHGEEGEAEGGEEADPAADVTRVAGVDCCGTKGRVNRGE